MVWPWAFHMVHAHASRRGSMVRLCSVQSLACVFLEKSRYSHGMDVRWHHYRYSVFLLFIVGDNHVNFAPQNSGRSPPPSSTGSKGSCYSSGPPGRLLGFFTGKTTGTFAADLITDGFNHIIFPDLYVCSTRKPKQKDFSSTWYSKKLQGKNAHVASGAMPSGAVIATKRGSFKRQ
jgi:hypothetical protein